MNKGYIIPHTHWDREWRYPIWENRKYLIELVDELLTTLDNNPEYQSFLFDGQTVSLLDYIEVRPEKEEKLKNYIREGRILVGPWYTLPDLYPVSGESLVRNLLKGRRTADKLGRCMLVGYESFGWGQTAQFPQIYQGFGIDTVFIAKNVDKTRAPKCEFLWEGADGTQVLATRLGDDARANFFMNAYLEIMNGMQYKSDEYRYKNGKQGMVYHQADNKNFIQDYFMLEHSEKVHGSAILSAFMKAWEGMKDSLLPEHRALMNGSDSTTAQPFMIEMINRINQALKDQNLDIQIESSSIEDYVKLLKTIEKSKLPVVKGELRDGPTTSLSGNALMTRPYIKMLNKKVQNALFQCAEPFSVACGFYDNSFLNKAVDYLLLSHPHDSINGVTQDKTVDDVMYMLSQSLELSEVIYNSSCKEMLKNIDTSGFEQDDVLIAVFNPLPFPVSDTIKVYVDTPQEKCIWDFTIEDKDKNIVPTQFVSRSEVVVPVSDLHARPWPYYADRHCFYLKAEQIPAGGYKIYKLNPGTTFNRNAEYWPLTRKTNGQELSQSANQMENEFLSVRVNQNGTISVLDKVLNKTYENLNYFEDEGDCGDYWMFYPPYENKKYSSIGAAAEIWTEDNGELSCTIAAKIQLTVPAYADRHMNGIKGKSRRSSEMTVIPITAYYTLKKDGKSIEVKLIVENTAEDHRLKLLFDTNIKAETAFAQGHFNVDKRPYLPMKDQNGMYYNELTTQPMQNFLDITDGKSGFGITSNSFIEYEAIPNEAGTLAFTLLRAVRNIICTEMRSGGHFPNQKGGQSLRTLEYNYAIHFHTGDYEKAELYQKADILNVPLKPVQTSKQLQAGTLPLDHSFYELSSNLVLSALKKCEDSSDFLLRVYNPYEHQAEGFFLFSKTIIGAVQTDLNESEIRPAEFMEHKITIKAKPNEIITVKFSTSEVNQ